MPARQVRLRLIKTIEHALQVFGRDANPVVRHRDLDVTGHRLRRDENVPARVRERDGVPDHVTQRDLDFSRLSLDREGGRADLGAQCHPLAPRLLVEGFRHIPREARHRDLAQADARRAVLVIFHAGQVLHDIFQARRVADDQVQLLVVLRAHQFAQERGVAEDQPQGSPQFVGGDGDKVRFEAVEIGHLAVGPFHLSLQIMFADGKSRQRSQDR